MEKYDYVLPEGFTEKDTGAGYEYYDETGRACVLYTSGYYAQVGDRTHYLVTRDQRRIPLQQVFRSGK